MQSWYTLRNRVIPTYCLLSECYSNSPLAISVALQIRKLCRSKLPDVSEFLIDFWSIALNWNQWEDQCHCAARKCERVGCLVWLLGIQKWIKPDIKWNVVDLKWWEFAQMLVELLNVSCTIIKLQCTLGIIPKVSCLSLSLLLPNQLAILHVPSYQQNMYQIPYFVHPYCQ